MSFEARSESAKILNIFAWVHIVSMVIVGLSVVIELGVVNRNHYPTIYESFWISVGIAIVLEGIVTGAFIFSFTQITIDLRWLVHLHTKNEIDHEKRKKCPYCKEMILVDSLKCRYCHSEIKEVKKEVKKEVDNNKMDIEKFKKIVIDRGNLKDWERISIKIDEKISTKIKHSKFNKINFDEINTKPIGNIVSLANAMCEQEEFRQISINLSKISISKDPYSKYNRSAWAILYYFDRENLT